MTLPKLLSFERGKCREIFRQRGQMFPKYLLKNNFLISESSDLGKGSEMWSDRVVPLTTHNVMFNVELLHLRI